MMTDDMTQHERRYEKYTGRSRSVSRRNPSKLVRNLAKKGRRSIACLAFMYVLTVLFIYHFT